MVNFDEKTHTYTNEGKVLISTTQLLKMAGISPNYSSVNKDVLEKAAEYGTLVHKEIENYCKEGIVGFTLELEQFITWLKKNEYEVVASELLVHNDIVAGTIDLVLKKGEKTIIADIKTTSTIHTESVSYQTSIYKDLYAQQVDELLVIQFKQGNMKVKSLIEKTKEQINKLYDLVRNNETQLPTNELDQKQLQEIYRVENLIAFYENQVKKAKEEQQQIRQTLISSMKENGINRFENEKIAITYIAPSITQTLDTTRLKSEKPDIYTAYLKETKRAEQVRITLKENKDD